MMKRLSVIVLAAIVLTLAGSPVIAAKLRVRRKTASGKSAVSYSSAKLSRPTNSVIVTFLNLQSVKSVSYELSYDANGIAQGATGTLIPTSSSEVRDLYFGTCSKGVCTPHYNIADAELIVRATLKTGASRTKLYRIKI